MCLIELVLHGVFLFIPIPIQIWCSTAPIQEASSSTSRTKRMKTIDEETKAAISGMTSAADLPYDERKRQYASLGRAINREANPALVAKYRMANDGERFLTQTIYEFMIDDHSIGISRGAHGFIVKQVIAITFGSIQVPNVESMDDQSRLEQHQHRGEVPTICGGTSDWSLCDGPLANQTSYINQSFLGDIGSVPVESWLKFCFSIPTAWPQPCILDL